VQFKYFITFYYSVTCIIASLKPHDHIYPAREQIHYPSLSFITPLEIPRIAILDISFTPRFLSDLTLLNLRKAHIYY